MSDSVGYDHEMARSLLDHRLCEAVITGSGPVPDELWDLASFADDARSLGRVAAPAPSAELRAMFAVDRSRSAVVGSVRRGLGVGARVAIGMGFAFVGLTGAAAAGVLPEVAQHAVSTVVNSVSPFPDIPDAPGDRDLGGTAASGDSSSVRSSGHVVASVGSGASSKSTPSSAAGAPTATAATTPAAGLVPEWSPAGDAAPPGQSGETGEERRAQTPAGDNANNGNAKGVGNGKDTAPGQNKP